jgi:apolipoprotein N-acyltransferase
MITVNRFKAAFLAGLAVSTGYPVGIAASVLMPPLALRAESRRAAYESALSYYAGALWPLMPGAENFFGPDVSPFAAFGLWAIAGLLLALPWPLVWTQNVQHALWRAPLGLALTVIPPLGIIGWASPLNAAGFLFPATGWCGLLFCALLTGALALWPKQATIATVCIAVVANLMHPPEPSTPADWKAISTHFGSIAHAVAYPLAEYQDAEKMQQEALSARASVIVFPETVVPYWTASTDVFWQQTLAKLKASGKTVLIGARIPTSAPATAPAYDFSAELAILHSASLVASTRSLEAEKWSPAYFNGLVIRGAQASIFEQRIPVPIAMWNPLRPGSAPLHLAGPGVIRIADKRAAILICYEQLIIWPVFTSMLRQPEVLIGAANDYWAADTAIPRFQRSAVQSWARLFRIPYLLAVNT